MDVHKKLNIRLVVKHGSHLPVLIKVVLITTGDVAEFGAGIYSTPVLHWLCVSQKRNLVSYDNDEKYVSMYGLKDYENGYHKIITVKDWDELDLSKPLDVAFIDHKPRKRRIIEIERLSMIAKYIIVHDTGWKQEKHYHYKEIYPLFKYRYDFNVVHPPTTILSNFVDLKDFSI